MQDAAGVVAQVDNQPLKVAFVFELDNCLFNFPAGATLELRDTEIAKSVLQISLLDTGHLDDFSCQGDRFRCRVVSFDQCDFYFAARFSAHGLDSVSQAHAFNRRAVNLDDQVTTLNAGFCRGRVVHR